MIHSNFSFFGFSVSGNRVVMNVYWNIGVFWKYDYDARTYCMANSSRVSLFADTMFLLREVFSACLESFFS